MPSGGCLCRNVKYEFDTVPCEKAQYAFTGEPIPNDCDCYRCTEQNSHLPSSSISVRRSLFKVHQPSSSLKSYTIDHPYGSTRINFCSNCGSTIYKDSEDPSFMGLDLVLIQGTTLDTLESFEWEKASADLNKWNKGAAMPLSPPESSDDESDAENHQQPPRGEVPTDRDERRVPESATPAEAAIVAAAEWQGCGCGCC